MQKKISTFVKKITKQSKKRGDAPKMRPPPQVVDERHMICDIRQICLFRFFFWRKRRKRKSLAKRKAPKNKVFRPLRRARRATRPPPRRLLKKAGENFQQADETRLFCLQSGGKFFPFHIFYTFKFLFLINPDERRSCWWKKWRDPASPYCSHSQFCFPHIHSGQSPKMPPTLM